MSASSKPACCGADGEGHGSAVVRACAGINAFCAASAYHGKGGEQDDTKAREGEVLFGLFHIFRSLF
ncbi:hypothetical protein NXV57_32240 [Bacteroides thetaiotaomicron]|nr:hypothetical protein [Bacteroides thetaiotaomicron]